MSSWKRYADKFHVKQWSIGFAKDNIADIIRQKKSNLSIEWLSPESKKLSYADPFIFRDKNNDVQVLFESVSTVGLDGKIILMSVDGNLKPISQKTLLETEAHLSYPFVYRENNKTYVLPENSLGGSLFCYEFDEDKKTLTNKKEIIRQPVVDATIVKREGKYWLFCTIEGPCRNSELHIFYADNLMGSYSPHSGNPVKKNLHSTRPAGNIVMVDGELFRPAQNCTSFYGESITVNKINKLTTDEFEETEHFTITANKSDEFNYGIHTINFCDDIIIVDGQKKYFQPIRQILRKLKKVIKK